MGLFSGLRQYFFGTKQKAIYQKRVMGRRQAIMKAVLERKFLDPYEIARRTGTTISDADYIREMKQTMPNIYEVHSHNARLDEIAKKLEWLEGYLRQKEISYAKGI